MDTMNKPFLFFVYWNWKIPKELLDKYECVGMHMTDLPYGRGGSPLQNLILRGFTETKITAFQVTDEWDAGPVYCKRPLSLDGTAQEIFDRASRIIYNDMIPFIILNDPVPVPQEGEVVLFHRINRSEYPEPMRMWDAWGYKK
jgi:methionyl-tRNA formyltransferase